jgi:UDP:flavonoid glycosyltransferase YjiC (YdhE family)
MRLAIEDVLSKGSYRQNAARFAQEIAESNGAARASDEIENLLPERARKAS